MQVTTYINNADGFYRNNFYIYLKILKLWDFIVVVVLVVFVVGRFLSRFHHQLCSLLAMDKIRSFWPNEKATLQMAL